MVLRGQAPCELLLASSCITQAKEPVWENHNSSSSPAVVVAITDTPSRVTLGLKSGFRSQGEFSFSGRNGCVSRAEHFGRPQCTGCKVYILPCRRENWSTQRVVFFATRFNTLLMFWVMFREMLPNRLLEDAVQRNSSWLYLLFSSGRLIN